MRPSLKFLVPTLMTSLLVAACGSSSSSSQSKQASNSPGNRLASGVLVRTAANSKLGTTVLVNAQGLTLYHLSGEQTGKFICTSAACVHVWHPLIAGSKVTKGSVTALSTVKRPDGVIQVTYKGMPLYTFAKDTAPGQATGQGIKDIGTWSAVSTSGHGSSPPAPATSSSGGGYAY